MHQNLIEREDLPQELKLQAMSEMGQDFLKAGLLDRAEEIFDKLRSSPVAEEAKRFLLEIYRSVSSISRCGNRVPADLFARNPKLMLQRYHPDTHG